METYTDEDDETKEYYFYINSSFHHSSTSVVDLLSVKAESSFLSFGKHIVVRLNL